MFVNENPKTVADLLEKGIVDIAQLHGDEDEEYIKALRKLTDRPLIKAFKIKTKEDLKKAEASREFEECMNKARASLTALTLAEGVEE